MSWAKFDRYITGQDFTDHVYANGQVVRVDKSAAQCADILSGYSFEDTPIWAGVTAPYKLYNNETLSVYCVGAPSFISTDLNTLYGIKIDTVTNTRLYKFQDFDYLGMFDCKVATYDSTGNILGFDYYFESSISDAKSFATLHNLVFPVPQDKESSVWVWGAYYGLDKDPQVMKAYVEVE